MSEHSSKKGTMAKDTIIYMIAKIYEGVFGVLTISALTYFFIPKQMGQYSTVNIAVTTIAMVGVQWLIQSSLRYINKYDIENEHEKFYTTVFTAWLKTNLGMVLGGSVLILLLNVLSFPQLKSFTSNYTVDILVLGLIMFVTYNTAQLVVAMLAATRRAKLNLFLSVFSVTGKLLTIVLLVRLFGARIQWIFVSYSIFDGITSLIGIITLKVYKYINFKNNSKEILDTLKAYGIPLVGNLITTSVLNKSDIYIITFFLGESSAGIYQTNYSIVSAAFTMLMAAVMRGSYPTIVRTWSEGKKELSEKLVSEAVRFFLLISVPCVVGIAVLSDFLARVLFAPSYFDGHFVMAWVALGMMFLGITEYCIKPWELNANTKAIFYRSLISGIVNLLVNIIFVPVFGYMTAAVSTFIGFFTYFCLAKLGTRKLMRWRLGFIVYLRIILSAVFMGALILSLKSIVPSSLFGVLLLVIIGIISYGLLLYFFGEIKNEAKLLVKLILRRADK